MNDVDKSELEYKILGSIVDCMEEKGSTYKSTRFNIDSEFLNDINESSDEQYTWDQLKKAADRCFTHEWLKRLTLGGGYNDLQITPRGVGVVTSRRKVDQMKASRPIMKKVSDYIEDHKGLFLALGFLIGVGGLVARCSGGA